MGLTKMTENVENIKNLDTKPNAVNGITAEELKAEFDKGPASLKAFLNDTLIPELDNGGVDKSEAWAAYSGSTEIVDWLINLGVGKYVVIDGTDRYSIETIATGGDGPDTDGYTSISLVVSKGDDYFDVSLYYNHMSVFTADTYGEGITLYTPVSTIREPSEDAHIATKKYVDSHGNMPKDMSTEFSGWITDGMSVDAAYAYLRDVCCDDENLGKVLQVKRGAKLTTVKGEKLDGVTIGEETKFCTQNEYESSGARKVSLWSDGVKIFEAYKSETSTLPMIKGSIENFVTSLVPYPPSVAGKVLTSKANGSTEWKTPEQSGGGGGGSDYVDKTADYEEVMQEYIGPWDYAATLPAGRYKIARMDPVRDVYLCENTEANDHMFSVGWCYRYNVSLYIYRDDSEIFRLETNETDDGYWASIRNNVEVLGDLYCANQIMTDNGYLLPIPTYGIGDAGKVLKVSSRGTLYWGTDETSVASSGTIGTI